MLLNQVPHVVYKYRVWDEGSMENRILAERQIRMSSPRDLDADYMEARLPTDYDSLTEERIMEFAMQEALKILPHSSYKDQVTLAKRLKSDSKIRDKENQNWAELKFKDFVNATLGIFCTSITNVRIETWEKLANLGTGYCVGLYTRKLFDHPMINGVARSVEYYPSGTTPTVKALNLTRKERVNNRLKAIFSVPDDYEHEEEFRFVRTHHVPGTTQMQEYEDADRLVSLSERHYEGIYLGYAISIKDKNQILEIASRTLPNTPIFQGMIAEDTVNFERVIL